MVPAIPFESSHRDLNMKYLFGEREGTFLEIAYLFDDFRKRSPWKIGICSVTKNSVNQKICQFNEQKFSEHILAYWKIPEKDAPERKELIFLKIVSVAASVLL